MKVLAVLALIVCAVNAKSLQLVGDFSFDSCDTTAPIQVTAFTVSPDPIVLPGKLTVSMSVGGTVDVTSPTDFNIVLEKNVDGSWVEIPCVDNIGSCDVTDICTALSNNFPDGAGCPQAIVDSGLNCNCPIKAGNYDITNLVIDVALAPPASITDGSYHVGVTVNDASGKQIGCLDIYADVEVAA